MANYPAPDHPLTDRQQTAYVEAYENLLVDVSEELRDAFQQLENIIALHIVGSIHSRVRDTHIDTARKYAKALLATCLEQGHIARILK